MLNSKILPVGKNIYFTFLHKLCSKRNLSWDTSGAYFEKGFDNTSPRSTNGDIVDVLAKFMPRGLTSKGFINFLNVAFSV